LPEQCNPNVNECIEVWNELDWDEFRQRDEEA
jgi:hypothetical protein